MVSYSRWSVFHCSVGHCVLVLFVFFALNEGNSTGTVTVSRMKNYNCTESLANNFIIAPIFQVVYVTIYKRECWTSDNKSGTESCGSRRHAIMVGAGTCIRHQSAHGSNPNSWLPSCTLRGNWVWHTLDPRTLFLLVQKENLMKIIKSSYIVLLGWEYLWHIARILTYLNRVNLLKKLDSYFYKLKI